MSTPVSFIEILQNTLSTDINLRTQATEFLTNAQNENFAGLLRELIDVLFNEANSADVRRVAGLFAKNSLTATADDIRTEILNKWQQVPVESRNEILSIALNALGTTTPQVGSVVAQLVAAIEDLQARVFNSVCLLPQILGLLESQTNLTMSIRLNCLEAMSFICELLNPNMLYEFSSRILNVLFGVLNSSETDMRSYQKAISALNNVLRICRTNFDNPAECGAIMAVILKGVTSADQNLQVQSLQCLISVVSMYYNVMNEYMASILDSTIHIMKGQDDDVILQSVELWSTLADEEIQLRMEHEEARALGQDHPGMVVYNFVQAALGKLIPALYDLLMRQDEDGDEHEWNVSRAASVCLSLIARCEPNDCLRLLLPQIQADIVSTDWRRLDAAFNAFGNILDGPDVSQLETYVISALPILTNSINHPHTIVQDTSSWVVGHICELFYTEIVARGQLEAMLSYLQAGMQARPRVASNCAWALMNLCEYLGDNTIVRQKSPPVDNATVMTPFFQPLSEALLRASDRQDGDQSNLREYTYEALSYLILFIPPSDPQILHQITETIISRLEACVSREGLILSSEERNHFHKLQSYLCSLLQSVCRRLGNATSNYADRMMTCLLTMFYHSNERQVAILEDALLAVGTIILAVEAKFERYMGSFSPYLTAAIETHRQFQLCSAGIGVLSDLCRALGPAFTPYAEHYVVLCANALQSQIINRSVKPLILAALGDIALAIGPSFAPHFETSINILLQAAVFQISTDNFDDADFMNELFQGVLDGFSGIIQGSNDPALLSNSVTQIFEFCHRVSKIHYEFSSLEPGLIGLMVDLFTIYPPSAFPDIRQFSTAPWVRMLFDNARRSRDSYTRETASIGLKLIA